MLKSLVALLFLASVAAKAESIKDVKFFAKTFNFKSVSETLKTAYPMFDFTDFKVGFSTKDPSADKNPFHLSQRHPSDFIALFPLEIINENTDVPAYIQFANGKAYLGNAKNNEGVIFINYLDSGKPLIVSVYLDRVNEVTGYRKSFSNLVEKMKKSIERSQCAGALKKISE